MHAVFRKIFGLFFLLTYLSNAQNQSAFQTFTLGANYTANINEETLHNYWTSGSGIQGYLSTPFYIGNLQVGLDFVPFEGKTEAYPDYNSFLLYVQWGYEFKLPLKFSLSINALTGITQMSFIETSSVTIDQGVTSEKEITLGLSSSLGYEISSSWEINISSSYQRIFTYKRINLLYISFGVSKSFDSPDWLIDFLE